MLQFWILSIYEYADRLNNRNMMLNFILQFDKRCKTTLAGFTRTPGIWLILGINLLFFKCSTDPTYHAYQIDHIRFTDRGCVHDG